MQVNKFDLDAKQEKKLFYIPDIGHLDFSNNKYSELLFVDDNGAAHKKAYAGKVLPGQSFREAIKKDLADDFGYDGLIDIADELTLVDKIKDKKGKLCERYGVVLTLEKSIVDREAKPLGYSLAWGEVVSIANENDFSQEESNNESLSDKYKINNDKELDCILYGIEIFANNIRQLPQPDSSSENSAVELLRLLELLSAKLVSTRRYDEGSDTGLVIYALEALLAQHIRGRLATADRMEGFVDSDLIKRAGIAYNILGKFPDYDVQDRIQALEKQITNY